MLGQKRIAAAAAAAVASTTLLAVAAAPANADDRATTASSVQASESEQAKKKLRDKPLMKEDKPPYTAKPRWEEKRAVAAYSDDTNRVYVRDNFADGRSAVLVVWKKGHYKNRIRYWNSDGAGEWRARETGWKENTVLKGKVCWGNWSGSPHGKNKIRGCGNKIKTFGR